jgi:hypothetical protein
MPLAFESLNHGTIAFGFFNIDSDMLLLEKYFWLSQPGDCAGNDLKICTSHPDTHCSRPAIR